MSPDWSLYEKTFPDRYLKPNSLDKWVEDYIRENPQERDCLDIGGGVHGTAALRNPLHRIWALDPNILLAPKGQAKIAWDTVTNFRFDLIVLRGSFNYLTPSEIEILPILTRPKGKILFNSFLLPSEIDREITTREGKIGRETTRFDQERQEIEHTLTFPGEEPIIHRFFHYPPQTVEGFFENHGILSIHRHKTNSLLYEFTRG